MVAAVLDAVDVHGRAERGTRPARGHGDEPVELGLMGRLAGLTVTKRARIPAPEPTLNHGDLSGAEETADKFGPRTL